MRQSYSEKVYYQLFNVLSQFLGVDISPTGTFAVERKLLLYMDILQRAGEAVYYLRVALYIYLMFRKRKIPIIYVSGRNKGQDINMEKHFGIVFQKLLHFFLQTMVLETSYNVSNMFQGPWAKVQILCELVSTTFKSELFYFRVFQPGPRIWTKDSAL
ncbi:hypothetical protein ACJX0J_019394 [Zea mays]